MGIWASKIWSSLFSSGEYKVVVIGLSNAGKTTLVYKMLLDDYVLTQPTVGSNVETVKYKNVTFQMWDVGGQESLRETWVRYFLGTHAVIFVVDSSDGSKLELNQEEFQRIVHHEELENACFLVFANKQDVAGALSEGQVSQGLALDTIRDRNYHIQACSALSGQGVNEGMDWLAHSLKQANGK